MTDEKKGAPITEKTRYSDAELAEFKAIIEEKLVQAKAEYKTYGICRATGKLIPKERLMRVPHATLTVEAKEQLAKEGKN